MANIKFLQNESKLDVFIESNSDCEAHFDKIRLVWDFKYYNQLAWNYWSLTEEWEFGSGNFDLGELYPQLEIKKLKKSPVKEESKSKQAKEISHDSFAPTEKIFEESFIDEFDKLSMPHCPVKINELWSIFCWLINGVTDIK